MRHKCPLLLMTYPSLPVNHSSSLKWRSQDKRLQNSCSKALSVPVKWHVMPSKNKMTRLELISLSRWQIGHRKIETLIRKQSCLISAQSRTHRHPRTAQDCSQTIRWKTILKFSSQSTIETSLLGRSKPKNELLRTKNWKGIHSRDRVRWTRTRARIKNSDALWCRH